MSTAVVKEAKSTDKGVYSKMVEITPEYAQELLAKNTINRPIASRSVKHYAQQMLKGDWCSETDESIKLSIDGCLIDGQHRLSAIVLAAIPIKLKITYNLPNEVFRYIDQGKKRTAKDILYIADVPNATQISGIIKAAVVLGRGKIAADVSSTDAQLSNEDIYQIYQEKPKYWQDICQKTGHWYRSFSRLATPSFLAAHYCLFSSLNVEDAEKFMEKLSTGIGISEATDPVKVLRDYYLKQLDLRGRKANNSTYNSILTIKAWNAFRQKKQMTQLRWDNREEYPKAI